MNVEQFKYLLEVARIGSINQASERLHTSQQNVSRVLRQLEKELDTTLFIRTHQGIALTETGYLAVEAAKEVVLRIEQLKSDCQQTQAREIAGEVRLLCPPATVFTLLQDIISRFNMIYPQITLSVHELEAGALFEALAQDPAAVGITTLFFDQSALPPKVAQYRDALSMELLFTDRMAAFIGKKHPLARQKSISLSSILKHPLALYLVGDREDNLIYHLLKVHGQPRIVFTSQNTAVYIQHLAQGQCIGFSSNVVFEQHQFYDKSDLSILSVRGNTEFATSLTVNKAFQPTPAAEKFMVFIREQF